MEVARRNLIAKSRSGDLGLAEPGLSVEDAAGTLEPQPLSQRLPASSRATLPLLPLAHVGCFHGVLCLPDLSHPHPQSLSTSSSVFCPELQQVQPPLRPAAAPSPPAQLLGAGRHKQTCAPRLALSLGAGSASLQSILRHHTSLLFLTFSNISGLFLPGSGCAPCTLLLHGVCREAGTHAAAGALAVL